MEEENGALFPPNGPTASCPKNVKPNETRCFENCKWPFNTCKIEKAYDLSQKKKKIQKKRKS